MARHRKSRKHPLFSLLIVIGLLVFAVFYFAASRIAKQVRAGIEVNWICYFALGLAVASTTHVALSIILFTYLPPKQIPCCSLFTITTLCLGTAWTFSTIVQIFEDKSMSMASTAPKENSVYPPLLKVRAILSGVLALLTFVSALLSSLNSFGDEIPRDKSNQGPVQQSLVSTSHITQPLAPQNHNNEAPHPFPDYPTAHHLYPSPAELDSCPIEICHPRIGDKESGRKEIPSLKYDYPHG